MIYSSLPPLNVGFSKMKCCEFLARTNQTPSFFDNRSMKLEFIYTSNTIQLHEQFFPTYFLDILMMECHMYVWHGVFCFLIFKHSIFRKIMFIQFLVEFVPTSRYSCSQTSKECYSFTACKESHQSWNATAFIISYGKAWKFRESLSSHYKKKNIETAAYSSRI